MQDSRRGEGNMRCPLCKGEMVKGRKTNLPYELSDERVIIVRNVPAIICFQCGDAFIEADILSKIEKILQALGSGLQYCNSGNCFQ